MDTHRELIATLEQRAEAAERERDELRAENERLRGSLRKISTVDVDGLAEYTPQAMVHIARATLSEKGDE